MTKKKVTLKEFINENHRLISVMGLFGALSAYFSTLDYFNHILGFITYFIFLLFCFELLGSIHENKNISRLLILFESFFILFVILIGVYIWINFKESVMNYLLIPFILFYNLLFQKLDDKLNICEEFSKENKTHKPLFVFAYFLIIIAFSIYFGLITHQFVVPIILNNFQ